MCVPAVANEAEQAAQHAGVLRRQAVGRGTGDEALRQGARTLAAVAREVGYGSESALSAASKRQVGEAPSHWRAKALPAG